MRSIRIILLTVAIMGLWAFVTGKLRPSSSTGETVRSIYDFKIKSLEGDLIDFQMFKGKYLLIVNTASKCTYTPQYADLQTLHENYGDHVTVLGFPSNNFLWQEPASNTDISVFCKKNFGVTFQMFEKISVKGKDQHPLYQWLSAKSRKSPSWNFCKYLIDKEGNVVDFFSSKVNPLDKKIIARLKD